MSEQPHGPVGPWIPDDSTFSARLALIRNWMGWGNVKVAALACGIPVATWRSWERDGAKPHDLEAAARRIAARTGADYGWVLGGGEAANPSARGAKPPLWPVPSPARRRRPKPKDTRWCLPGQRGRTVQLPLVRLLQGSDLFAA